MANLQVTSRNFIYQGGPSLEEMLKDRKYRQTIQAYRGAIQDGMMVMPEDLEGYPAPVLCPYCEVPGITRTKTQRNGKQKFNIAWATLASVGALTYSVASTNKDIIHECPNCDCAIAAWLSQMNGGWHEIKVYRSYKVSGPDGPLSGGIPRAGHSFGNITIGGHAVVQLGDQFLLK